MSDTTPEESARKLMKYTIERGTVITEEFCNELLDVIGGKPTLSEIGYCLVQLGEAISASGQGVLGSHVDHEAIAVLLSDIRKTTQVSEQLVANAIRKARNLPDPNKL